MVSVSKLSSKNSIPQQNWQTAIAFVLAFWLSSSVVIDALLMPVMAVSGMMTEPGFATAGYSLFWVFNRVELLCAAIVLTGALGLRHSSGRSIPQSVALSALLGGISLIFTYGLTPQMSGLGLQLNLFTPPVEASALMDGLHLRYWLLEAAKLTIGALLLQRSLQPARSIASDRM